MSHQSIEFNDGFAAEGAQGSQDTCLEQLVVNESATQVECVESSRKMRSVTVTQGQEATIRHTMRTPNGDPVDLSFCAGDPVKLRLREAIGTSETVLEIDGVIVDVAAGAVEAVLTEGSVAYAGIVLAEFAIFDGDGKLRFSNQLWLIVNYGLFAAEAAAGKQRQGPPTLPEIRLHLYDNDPADNTLLEDVEFDGSEIAVCINRVVEHWNNSPPPIHTYTTMTFPYRFLWLDGIVAGLMSLATAKYMRNHLPYTAGGLAVNDKGKFAEYGVEGQRRWSEVKRAILVKKAELNANMGYGSLLSPYSGGTW